MIDLAMSVVCATIIFVIFKLFARYGVTSFYAIPFNYMTASVLGPLFYGHEGPDTPLWDLDWFWPTAALGAFFIAIFNLIARSSQVAGVSATSVATKMSLIIPVIFGFYVYHEPMGPYKVVGILLALAAVYFVSVRPNSMLPNKAALLLPASVFLGSGIIDTSIKYIQETFLTENEFPLFSAVVFAAAATVGMVLFVVRFWSKREFASGKDILGGIVLGIPNYFSVHFLLRALHGPNLDSATVFTVNNVGVVILSTLLGIVLFHERITSRNWGGIVMAVVSIFLVALS